jgi:hypothetical protein
MATLSTDRPITPLRQRMLEDMAVRELREHSPPPAAAASCFGGYRTPAGARYPSKFRPFRAGSPLSRNRTYVNLASTTGNGSPIRLLNVVGWWKAIIDYRW